jgi:hypothetical protein
MFSNVGLMNDDREAKLEKLLHENKITFLSDSDIAEVIREMTNTHKAHNMCNNKQFIDDYTLTLYVKNMYNLGVIVGNISTLEFKDMYMEYISNLEFSIINKATGVTYNAIYDLFNGGEQLFSPHIEFDKRKVEKRQLQTVEEMRQWCFKNPLKIVGVQRDNKVAIKTQNDVNNLVVGFARDISGCTFTHVLQYCTYKINENNQQQTWIHYSEIDAVE